MKNLTPPERIEEILEYLNIKADEFGKKVNDGRAQSIYDIINGKTKSISDNMKNKIIKHYPEISEVFLLAGVPPMLKEEKETSENNIKPNVTPKELKGVTTVKLVQKNAVRGAWQGNYYSDEFLEDLPEIKIVTEENHFEKHLAFEVEGDSMEPEYYEGDIVICRELSRNYWTNRLPIDKCDFVIAHNELGLLLKEISNHNVDNGDITIHSLNDFYKDQVLNLKDVTRLFNVVEVRPDLKRRRIRRK